MGNGFQQRCGSGGQLLIDIHHHIANIVIGFEVLAKDVDLITGEFPVNI
jgi:hypothetical protein